MIGKDETPASIIETPARVAVPTKRLGGAPSVGPSKLYPAAQVQSSNQLTSNQQSPPWREAGLRYYSYNHFLRRRFGGRVQKVSLDAGFTCPNVDGTVAKGGCTFCDNRSFSPSRRLPRSGILGQIDQSIE